MNGLKLLNTAELLRTRYTAAQKLGRPFPIKMYTDWLLKAPEALRRNLQPEVSNRDFYDIPRYEARRRDPIIIKLLDESSKAQTIQRRTNWQYKIWDELRLANEEDHYAIFATCTIDDRKTLDYRAAIADGWLRYKKRMLYRTGRDTRYACVVERGTLGRLHLHCIWICPDIPETWKRHDPNMAVRTGTQSELHFANAVWTLGRSQHIPIRLAPDDAWGKLGWRWPYARDFNPRTFTGPSTIENPSRVSAYLAKYIAKDISTSIEETFKWRTRATRQFGMTTINLVVHKMPLHLTRILTQPLPPLRNKHGKLLPTNLLRQNAKRRISLRRLESRKKAQLHVVLRQGRQPTLPQRLESMMDSATRKGPEFAALSEYDTWITRGGSYDHWIELQQYLDKHLPCPQPIKQSLEFHD